MWFLGTPTCNMKYMSSSTSETVKYLTLDLKSELWHHRLGYPGQHTLRLASDACDGIPKLQRYPFFK